MPIIDTCMLHVSVNACVVTACCMACLDGIMLFFPIECCILLCSICSAKSVRSMCGNFLYDTVIYCDQES
jgi:hypothetical protein